MSESMIDQFKIFLRVHGIVRGLILGVVWFFSNKNILTSPDFILKVVSLENITRSSYHELDFKNYKNGTLKGSRPAIR